MAARLSLSGGFVWNLLGSGLYSGMLWAVLILLARVGGKEELGAFALGLAIASPIMALANLDLRNLYVAEPSAFSFAAYARVRGVAVGAAALLTALVGALAYTPIAAAIAAVGVVRAVDGLSDVTYAIGQARDRQDSLNKGLMLRALVGLWAFSAARLLSGDLVLALWVWSAVWLGCLLLRDLPAAARLEQTSVRALLSGPVERGMLTALARRAAPLGLSALLVALTANAPRLFVEHLAGRDALGVFAAVAVLPLIGGRVIAALCGAASARLAAARQTEDHAGLRRLVGLLLGVAALIGSIGVVLASLWAAPILRGLYGEAFVGGASLLVAISIYGALFYVAWTLAFVLTSTLQLREQPPVLLTLLGVTVAGCALLVPELGPLGAAYALIAGVVVQIIWMGALCLRAISS